MSRRKNRNGQTGELYPRFAAAAVVVGIVATLLIDGGWTLWVGILPALLVVAKLKDVIGD